MAGEKERFVEDPKRRTRRVKVSKTKRRVLRSEAWSTVLDAEK